MPGLVLDGASKLVRRTSATDGSDINRHGNSISMVLVVDPFWNDLVVVTGSDNFSVAASGKNDENFIVVRGDRTHAETYAVNVDTAWRHCAGRAGNPYPKLRGIDHLRALWQVQRRDERFWRLTP